MQTLLANQAASISELKKNPSKLIRDADGRPIVILNHNVVAAYLIPAKTFERIMELLDDQDLQAIVAERLSDSRASIKVNLDEL